MGFRYRKSINLGGGFRVNISKSGIGYSWGGKGFRVTKTASGKTRQTISLPGTGLSYVTESGGSERGPGSNAEESIYGEIREIEAADVSKLRPVEYKTLFSKVRLRRIIHAALLIAMYYALGEWGRFLLLGGLWIAFRVLGGISISYDFDAESLAQWEERRSAWAAVARSQQVWEITAEADVKNKKRAAGASRGVDRQPVKVIHELPWYLDTNITPIVFKLKKCKIAIMPDRVMVFRGLKFGALPYDQMKMDLYAVGYPEEGKIPSDAQYEGTRWLMTNKDGTPDKRFANNREIDVYKYGCIDMTSKSGLDVRLMCSNESAVDHLAKVLRDGP